jgi:Cu-processing system permease protein
MSLRRHQLLAIAGQEWTVHARNRWTLVIAATFAVLVVAIAVAGSLAEGFDGLQSFRRTSTSLLNLVVTFIPLLSLIVGTLSFTGDRGSAELLFSQPVSRRTVLLGKTLGVMASLWASMLLGFAAAGVVILSANGVEGLLPYLALVGLSLVLAAVFVGIAVASAILSRRKARSFGVALALWFFFVLFYDLLVIGSVSLLSGPTATTALFISLFGNPVDMVRVASLLTLENAAIFGPAGAALLRFLGGPLLSGVAIGGGLLLWLVLPVLIADRRLRQLDL